MNIVFLNPTGALGGAEMSLLDILGGLRQARPAWSLQLVAAEAGPLVEQAKALGVAAEVLPFPPSLARLGDAGVDGSFSRLLLLARIARAGLSGACYAWKLRRLLARLDPDVVDSHGFKMHILAGWAKPRGKPLLWHVHDFVSSRPVMGRLMRRHLDRDTSVVTNSIGVAQDLKSLCGDNASVRAVYYGIDLERFSPSGPVLDLDSLAGLPPAAAGTVKVGLVATLARWKGHEVFLEALSLLAGDLPVRGYIVGGGIYRTLASQYSLDELRALADRLGLRDRAGFAGFVDDPGAAMRSLDIVVHASTRPEPFGRVIIEAMACAKPVIASPIGGAAELVSDGVDSLLHVPGDSSSLARSIERLARDPGLRSALGKAGLEKARRRFARARMTAELIPIYESLAAGRGL